MREMARARWRCRRGMLELDIILQRFMDQYYAQLSEEELQQFEILLSMADSDLWDAITARKVLPDQRAQSVLWLLQKS